MSKESEVEDTKFLNRIQEITKKIEEATSSDEVAILHMQVISPLVGVIIERVLHPPSTKPAHLIVAYMFNFCISHPKTWDALCYAQVVAANALKKFPEFEMPKILEEDYGG